MNKLALFCLVICFIGLSQAKKQQSFDKENAKQLFMKLQKSDVGKDIFTSIQLQLSTSTNIHVIDKILQMLQELQDSLTEQKDDTFTQLGNKNGECASQISDIQYDIDAYNEKLAQAEQNIPTLQEAADSKAQQAADKKAEITLAETNIRNLEEQGAQGLARYQDSKQAHNDMMEALQEAKKTIKQLSVNQFLQKGVSQKPVVFAQLTDKINSAKNSLKENQHIFLYQALLQLAQDVGIQADQEKVTQVIAIIDELLAYEAQTMEIERQAENMRKDKLEYDLTRLNEIAQFLRAAIMDLEGDAKTYQTRLIELTTDVSEWKKIVKAKNEQITLTTQACDDQTRYLHESLDKYNELLDIIRQVIVIFQSQAIQDLKEVFSDMQV